MKKALMVLVAMCAVSTTCLAEATLAEYKKITTGMTYSKVTWILGPPQKEFMSMEVLGIKSAVYQWYGRTKNEVLSVGFQDDKVVSKEQYGLE